MGEVPIKGNRAIGKLRSPDRNRRQAGMWPQFPASPACVSVPSPADRELPSAPRLAEVAEILAVGILRLRARQLGTHRGDGEQVRLDYSPERSVHADRLRPRRTAP